MQCQRLGSLLCLILAVTVPAGCSSLPGAGRLLPGATARANQTLDSQLAMARLSERHGDTRTAEQIYLAVLEKDPRNQLAHHRLGVLAAKNREHEQAAEYLDAATRLGTPSSELLNDVAFNLYLMGRLSEAESHFRQAIAADPQNKSARNNLGLVLGEMRRYEESLAEFRRGGSEAEAHANLAYAKTQAGDVAGAKSSYHRALTLNSGLKPAAEALIQLAQQPPPTSNSDPSQAALGRLSDSRSFGHRKPRVATSRDRTLAEVAREGPAAELFESVTERDRGMGRTRPDAAPLDGANPIGHASYVRNDVVTSRRDLDSCSALLPHTADQPCAQTLAKESSVATGRVMDSPEHLAAAAGESFVLSRVFRFPNRVAPAPTAEVYHRTMPVDASAPQTEDQTGDRLQAALPNPAKLVDAVAAPTAGATPWEPATRRHPAWNEGPLPSFDENSSRTTLHPPTPTAGESTPLPGTVRAASTLFLSSAQGTASSNPWQTPTWTPDFDALFSAAHSDSPSTPDGTVIPAQPLRDLHP